VTSIYEYREVQTIRSTRANKLLGEEMLMMIGRSIDPRLSRMEPSKAKAAARDLISFDECEEIVTRMAWCRAAKNPRLEEQNDGLTTVKEEDEFRSSMRSLSVWGGAEVEPHVSIPLKSCSPPRTQEVAFSSLANPCEIALFAEGVSECDLDDEETPLHLLVYRSLLKLPTDVRSICMARVVFVGGGAKLPGLKGRVLDELSLLLRQRGWDPVQGKAVEALRNNPKINRTRSRQLDDGPSPVVPSEGGPAHSQPHDDDPIEAALQKEARKHNPPVEEGTLRAIDSLGAWSGGSLLSHLKVPAVSVIDKDQWLQHGVLGASRNGEISVSSRQSMGPGAFKAGGGERSSWTLGLWA